MKLIVVESPAKARTIEKFLGKEYKVEASYGHIRDLPEKASQIPQKYRDKSWKRLAVDVDGEFEPIYVISADSKDQVAAMAEVARKHAEPVGSEEQKLIWLNTWNNWAETATVEPTANLGPKYPAGNYQFDMLEVVRDVFGPETYSCETP